MMLIPPYMKGMYILKKYDSWVMIIKRDFILKLYHSRKISGMGCHCKKKAKQEAEDTEFLCRGVIDVEKG
ncbi:hypothetical protein ACIQYL_04445 [Lysinibacillus xylanilyticus]|uniref:hypothetical protein n=1 Tax=Lysinibacillus xylanilyticus TaxID=582475 RepID=UPI00381155AD